MPITGTVSVADGVLASYAVSYQPLGGGVAIPAFTGTSPVSNGLLGTLDTTTLRDGQYVLHLDVTTVNGLAGSLTGPTIVVVGELKVGNFRFTVTDLSVPVLGIPITVNRTYDNFQRTQGDFGVDWSESTVSASTVEDPCTANISVQLPITDQPITFMFDPVDTGRASTASRSSPRAGTLTPRPAPRSAIPMPMARR